MVDTKVNLSGLVLDNPIIPASGTFGYGYEYAGAPRIVDVAVRRLREKLEECAEGAGRTIATRHGVGYYYDPQEK